MVTFEEAREVLARFVDELPPEIFKELNCGVVMTPDTEIGGDGLFVLGHYHFDPRGLGRYITVYYGSLQHIYGHLPAQKFHEKIKYVLHHELTHHLESLAGDRSLEIQDEIDRARYLNRG